MSDRCIVQKKFNENLQSYCRTILPEMVEDWVSFSEDGKTKIFRINDLFCGLHFMVGLADQAEGALKGPHTIFVLSHLKDLLKWF